MAHHSSVGLGGDDFAARCNVHFVAPGAGKVTHMDVHPTLPLVATCSKKLTLGIWDFDKKDAVATASLGSLEEGRKAEGMSMFLNTQLQEKRNSTKMSSVRSVQFVDADVAFWKRRSFECLSNTPKVTTLGDGSSNTTLKRDPSRCIVVVSESKTLIYNYQKHTTHFLLSADFDGKHALTATVLPSYTSLQVAFGCSDGVIRIWDAESWSPKAKLTPPAAAKAIAQIELHQSGSPNSPLHLLCIGTDGVAQVWRTEGSGDLAIPFTWVCQTNLNSTTVSVDPVWDVLWCVLDNKHIVARSLANSSMPEISTERWPTKQPLALAVPFTSQRVSSGAVICTQAKDSKLFSYSLAGDTNVKELIDLNSYVIDSDLMGGKKVKAHLSGLIVHPLIPSYLFIGTNYGCLILSVKPSPPLVCPKLAGAEEAGRLSCYAVVKTTVPQAKMLRTTVSAFTLPIGKSSSTAAESDLSSVVIDVPEATKTMTTSPSGKYLSIVYRDLKVGGGGGAHDEPPQVASMFKVINVITKAEISSGYADSVAWCVGGGQCERFAKLVTHETPKATGVKKSFVRKSLFGRKKNAATETDELERQSIIHIMEIVGGDGAEVVNCLQTLEPPNSVHKLFGGPVLGVVYDDNDSGLSMGLKLRRESRRVVGSVVGTLHSEDKECPQVFAPSSSASNAPKLTFQFAGFDDLRPVGPLLPQPISVNWNDHGDHVLLSFANHARVLRVESDGADNNGTGHLLLRQVGVLEEVVVSCLWHKGSLFIATPTTVSVMFVHFHKGSNLPEGDSTVIPLLNFEPSGAFPSSSNLSVFDHCRLWPADAMYNDGGGPFVQNRPPGDIALVGVHAGALVLMDDRNHFWSLPLCHPVLCAFMLVQAGHPDRAIAWAPAIQSYWRSKLAFLLHLSGCTSVALQIDGLDRVTRVKLFLASGMFRAAADILEELELSVTSQEGGTEPTSAVSGNRHQVISLWREIAEACVSGADVPTERFAVAADALKHAFHLSGDRTTFRAYLGCLAASGQGQIDQALLSHPNQDVIREAYLLPMLMKQDDAVVIDALHQAGHSKLAADGNSSRQASVNLLF